MLWRWKRQRSLLQLLCRAWVTCGPKTEVDFAGTAEDGVCSSKALKYFGLKLHSVVSLTGVVMGFLLAGASRYDNQATRTTLREALLKSQAQVSRADDILHRLRALLRAGRDAADT